MAAPILTNNTTYRLTLKGRASGQDVQNTRWYRTESPSGGGSVGDWFDMEDLIYTLRQHLWYNATTLMSSLWRQQQQSIYTLIEWELHRLSGVQSVPAPPPYVPIFDEFFLVTQDPAQGSGLRLGTPLPLQCTTSLYMTGAIGASRVRNGMHISVLDESDVGVGADANILSAAALASWTAANDLFTQAVTLDDGTPAHDTLVRSVVVSPRIVFTTSPAGGTTTIVASKTQPYVASQNSRKTKQP